MPRNQVLSKSEARRQMALENQKRRSSRGLNLGEAVQGNINRGSSQPVASASGGASLPGYNEKPKGLMGGGIDSFQKGKDAMTRGLSSFREKVLGSDLKEDEPTPERPGVQIEMKKPEPQFGQTLDQVFQPGGQQVPPQAPQIQPPQAQGPEMITETVPGFVQGPPGQQQGQVYGQVPAVPGQPVQPTGQDYFSGLMSDDPYQQFEAERAAAEYQQQAAIEAGQAQLEPYEQVRQGYEERQAEIMNEIKDLTVLSPEQMAQMEDFRDTLSEREARQIERVQERTDGIVQQIKEGLAYKGWGRSSKEAELVEKAQRQLSYDIADIRDSTQDSVGRFETSLLSKNNAVIEGLQDRLTDIYDKSDDLLLKEAELRKDIVKSVFEASPNNPDKLIEIVDRIKDRYYEAKEFEREGQKLELDYLKFDQTEREFMVNKINNFVEFGVENFGSEFVDGMPPEVTAALAEITGVPLSLMQKGMRTVKEKQMQFDAMKWETGRQDQYTLKQMDIQAARDKMATQYGMDINKMKVKQGLDLQTFQAEFTHKSNAEINAAATRMAAFMGPAYNKMASESNGSYLTFGAPVAHPNEDANFTVVQANSKIANYLPNGYQYSMEKFGDTLVGQCGWFAQQITDLGGLGNSLSAKTNSLSKAAKNGVAFYKGEQPIRPGHTILTNESKVNGHIVVVNAITADGQLVLTESNYASPLKVTHTRLLDPNSDKIVGIFATKPKDELKEALDVGRETISNPGEAMSGAIDGIFDFGGAAMDLLGQFTGATQIDVSNPEQAVPYQPIDVASTEITPDMGALYALSQGQLSDSQVKSIQDDFYKMGGYSDPTSAALFTKAFTDYKSKSGEKSLTEGQSKTNWAAGIMEAEAQTMDSLSLSADDLQGVDSMLSKALNNGEITYTTPIGAILYSGSFTPNQRMFINSMGRWTNASLRQQSGAAISVGEYINTRQQYFPVYGETEQEIIAKREARDREPILLRQGLPEGYNQPNQDNYNHYLSLYGTVPGAQGISNPYY